MNINEIKELLLAIEETSLNYIKIEKNEFKLEVSKNNTYVSAINDFNNKNLEDRNISNLDDIKQDSDITLDYCYVVAPLMGTFYSSPSPKEKSFIKVGDIVNEGDTLCILEAMKLMNEITSEFRGEIIEILVENEDLVEYNQPLIKIKPLE